MGQLTQISLEIIRGTRPMLTCQVSADDRTTLLDALEEVRVTGHPDLLYRRSCHHGSCGTCGVLANGRPVLACTTALATLAQPIRISPLPGPEQIGDLAVEGNDLIRDVPWDLPYLRTTSNSRSAALPGEVSRFEQFEQCIECGLCMLACPVVADPSREFLGPAPLAAWSRRVDGSPAEAIQNAAVDSRNGVEQCDQALACVAVCPVGISPAREIAVMKRKLTTSE